MHKNNDTAPDTVLCTVIYYIIQCTITLHAHTHKHIHINTHTHKHMQLYDYTKHTCRRITY